MEKLGVASATPKSWLTLLVKDDGFCQQWDVTTGVYLMARLLPLMM